MACTLYTKWHTTGMPIGDHAQFDVHYKSKICLVLNHSDSTPVISHLVILVYANTHSCQLVLLLSSRLLLSSFLGRRHFLQSLGCDTGHPHSKPVRIPIRTQANYPVTESCVWRGMLRIKLNFPSVGTHLRSIQVCEHPTTLYHN